MKKLVLAAALAAGVSLPLTGEAAETPDVERLAAELRACSMIEDPTERLRCYDEAMGAEFAPESQVVEEGGEILAIAGTDDFDSEPFAAEEPWYLRWINDGSILTLELRDGQGDLVGIVGNQIGAGDGRSDLLDPGSYTLAVRGIGSWEIEAVYED